jgi:hypothetical protein
MKKITDFLTDKYVIGFGAGVAAAVIGCKVYKSKAFRKAAANILAQWMNLRDEAKFTVAKIKEEAEDIYAEAAGKESGAEDTAN